MNRNSNLFTALALVVSLIMNVACSSPDDASKAKYIFLFIGDGMGNGQIALAESYLSYAGGELGGSQLNFTDFPVHGSCATYSENRIVTCSAAAGTAIACGSKTNNNALGVDKDGRPLESVAVALKNEGYKVGIISDVQVNHATPAAFYAHQTDRNNYYEIGLQLPESGFEFFAGSGFYKPHGNKGEDSKPLDACVREQGYEVCYGLEEFNSVGKNADKVVFLQDSGRKKDTDFYVSNGKEKKDVELDVMVSMALEHLGDEGPFFIMCEGGEIDWAAHENKTMNMVHEILSLQSAVEVALEFYDRHPDETLIIVTADHETGGAVLGQGYQPGAIENMRWHILDEQWKASGGKGPGSFEENRTLNESALIGWTTSHHTGAPVPLFAKGKGSEKFGGRMENSDIKGKILGEHR